jgi:hypothetical protein
LLGWNDATGAQNSNLLCRNLFLPEHVQGDVNKKEGEIAVIEQVAEMAMQLGQRHLADYGSTRSRKDFTQRQLMACLILRAYLKTTYRGIVEVLSVSASLRQRLGLVDKLPHFTALQKFSTRSQVLEIAQAMMATIGKAAVLREATPSAAAMDSTGLEGTTVSDYFCNRRGRACHHWVKVSVIVLCGSLLPLAMVLSLGPSNDRCQAAALLDQAQAVARPDLFYADAGYDAEWIHQRCREQWGVESVIRPASQRADGTRGGKWRSGMSPEHLKQRQYGRRWAVESFFSGLKRSMGSALSARSPAQLLAETAFRVLAYALRR